jgi:death-on-curing family protein
LIRRESLAKDTATRVVVRQVQTRADADLEHPAVGTRHHPRSLARLAAAYGYGVVRGYCFTDGNKRLALTVIDVFLQINGAELTASEPDVVVTLQALAAGEITEDRLAEWVAENLRPVA